MLDTATLTYLARLKQVEDSFPKLWADNQLPTETPEPVLKTTIDPYTGVPSTAKVLEAIFIVSRFGYSVSTGHQGGIACLARPALSARNVLRGSHEICLRSNPAHTQAIERYFQHQRDQKAFHDLADSKKPGRVNVGIINVPGER